MAKKKSSHQEKLIEALFDKLSQVPLDELNQMLQVVSNKISYIDNHPRVDYSYQCPDYAKKTRPIAEYLHTIEQIEWDYDVSETYIRDLLSKPAPELADELENLIINGLATFQQVRIKNKTPRQTKFIIALLLLKEIRSTKSLDLVLELLRQDSVFLETYFDYFGSDVFPVVLHHLGSDQLPKLLEFMKEPGLFSFGKSYTFTAVANIACTTPQRRLEVISWICQVLNFFYDNRDDKTVFDCIVIDSFSYDILNIGGKEALPLLEKLYATNLVLNFIAPDIKGIRKIIKETPPFNPLDDIFICEMLEKLYTMTPSTASEEEQVFASLEKYLDEDTDTKEKKPKTLEAALTPKCFTLKISLQDIKPEIWRLVEVPSTLTLIQLHETIQTVMGWEDYHLHQFSKGKTYYMSEEQLEEQMSWASNCVDYTDVTIGELLVRKRSKICYEYDFGDGWEHDIILEAQRSYKAGEQPRIFLIDRANACPPEDCGGSPGYMALKDAMKNKRTKAYKEYVEWLGGPFDPQAFDDDKEEINEMLEGIL